MATPESPRCFGFVEHAHVMCHPGSPSLLAPPPPPKISLAPSLPPLAAFFSVWSLCSWMHSASAPSDATSLLRASGSFRSRAASPATFQESATNAAGSRGARGSGAGKCGSSSAGGGRGLGGAARRGAVGARRRSVAAPDLARLKLFRRGERGGERGRESERREKRGRGRRGRPSIKGGAAAKKRKRPIVYLSFPPSPSTFSPAEMKKGCGLFVGGDLIR